MKSIEDHIEFDKKKIEDPTVSSAARRHYKEELQELQEYVGHHEQEIKAVSYTHLTLPTKVSV